MRKNALLDQTLCLKFCAYYKPGGKEEFSCRGYAVVDRLMQAGKAVSFHTSGRKPDRAMADRLVQKMCMTCDFHENDCDFMKDRTAPPCGGFTLLVQLLGSEAILIEDIT